MTADTTHLEDRVALRDLFDAYASCADRRDAHAQAALFTEDTRFEVFTDGAGSEPTHVLHGREALLPAFDDLRRYEVTTHFNGQSRVDVLGDTATGESCTLAHHVWTENGIRTLVVASLRYLDEFRRVDGQWRFAARQLVLDWSETRPLGG